MSNLLYARWLMGLSLAFHIVFAAIGVAMPLLMVLAEWRFKRTQNRVYLELAKRWAKGTAVLFGVGAVSGTVVSFELGLLWPRFMLFAGDIIGFPFSLEGFAFFTEAIFLGIYLYGRDRVKPAFHMASGAIVALSGAASAFFVTLANAWMNNPTGFQLVDGTPINIDPVAAMFAPGFAEEVVHVLLSCYAATGFAVAGIHAYYLLAKPTREFHRAALTIAFTVGGIAALLLPLSGDFSARHVAKAQPRKLAALEGQFHTQKGAPLRIGGFPDPDTMTTPLAIEIPYGLSLLAFHEPNAQVLGLDAFPRDHWPNVVLVHIAFQLMVGAGSLMALVALWGFWRTWRSRLSTSTRFLKAVILLTPFGFIALQAGWMVTELGRQPFTIDGVMQTAQAVTPVPNLQVPFFIFLTVYIVLALMVIALIGRQIRDTKDLEVSP